MGEIIHQLELGCWEVRCQVMWVDNEEGIMWVVSGYFC